MDLANHHLANAMHAHDVLHAERFNEHRRIAEERRAEAPPVTVGEESRWYRAWYRLADAITFHHYRGHSTAH